MSTEAEILQLIDSMIVELLAYTPRESAAARTGQWVDTLCKLARQIGSSADALGMTLTSASSATLDGSLKGRPASGVDIAAWYEHVQELVEELQQKAETELARRFSAARGAGPAALEMEQDTGMLGDFVIESREHLLTIERELWVLEEDPLNMESIHAIFRGFHTIKGLAGIFNLIATRDLAHEVETLLDLVRAGHLPVSSPLIDVVLACADALTGAVNSIEQGEPVHLDAGGLLEKLREQMAPPNDFLEEPELNASPVAPAAVMKRPESGKQPGGGAVKVDTGKLDHLVDMVGELIIAQSLVQLDPFLKHAADPKLARNLSQLARITTELQKTAMSLRVVPVGQTFERMLRAFRDLIQKSGKQARLQLVGEDAELDRTIVEQLADPLMHMIRNSVDHGLEAPADRIKAGKSPEGTVRLAASHRSGHVVIEVSDDGRGLNRAKILRRAVERGMVKPDAMLAPNEILELIFEPGFSTAETITDVSGRGVGMDVVKKQIQKLRGRVEIKSEEGKGATFLLRLPLTLAIIDGLLVRIGSERYVLPVFAVQEILRPAKEAVSTIEGRHEVVLVRNRVVPLVRLYRLLGREPKSHDPYESLLVLAEIDGRRYCLMVDELLGKQEVVIKTLGDFFGQLHGISGAAILGDGCVGLILDLEGLLGREVYGAAA